jgi:cholesterol 7-dehydrogenase
LFERTERYRSLTELGYDFPERKISKGLVSKQDIANEVRKRRKVGELPPVYPNGWFFLILSEELVVGATKSVNALGQNFALFRDQEGKAHILDAYCPHNGANLGVGGEVMNYVLVCAKTSFYHSILGHRQMHQVPLSRLAV